VSLFVDTSALYALLVRSEEDHSEAAEAFRRLLEGGRSLVTTNYVLLETTALLQHRIGLAAVRDLDARIVPLLRIHWIGEDLHRQAVERLLHSDRRELSLVDWVSFTVMDGEGIREAFALDPDFEAQGYRLVPGG
jgi:predicted nucleic acid-binding protein